MAADDNVEPLRALCPPELRELLRSAALVMQRPVWGRRHGRHRSARAGVGLDFRDHRPYVPGDDLRQLDWRAFARRERPVLRQTEAEDELSLLLITDCGGNMAYGRGDHSKIACVRAIAGGLAWLARRQGDPVGFALGRDGTVDAAMARPSTHRERHVALAHALGSGPVRGVCPWDELLATVSPRVPRRSLVVVLSDFLDPSGDGELDADTRLIRGLSHLRGRGHDVVAVQVLHRDEIDFTWAGQKTVKFLDLFGIRRPSEGSGAAFREAYLARFEAHQRLFKARCDAEGLFVARVVTDEPLAALFVGLLGRLAGAPAPQQEEAPAR